MLRALGSGSCDITHETGGTICLRHCVLRLVISYTRGCVLLRALGSVSCDITHETGGTICYGHWVLRLVISHTRQGVRFVTGIAFCVLSYHTRDRGYDLLRALGSGSCDITHETGGTICLRHCVLRLVISYTRGCVLLRALGSVSCDITHETGGTICYGHWVLRLVISHTRQGVRFLTGIAFCVL